MQLDSQEYGTVIVITVAAARIDAAVAVQFKDKLRELVQDSFERVILDLHQVEFLDSSGLGAVVGARKQLGQHRHLELSGMTPNVRKVFRLTRMDTVFTIHANLQAAMDGLANAS